MCRLAAYLGPPLRLDRLLLEPAHSLIEQAHSPRETLSAKLSADGVGIGWYDASGRPAVYRSLLPAWADPNLEHLGRSIERPLWLANVRSATDPLSNGYANTQPFCDERLMLLHNGFVGTFVSDLRRRLRDWYQPDIERGIAGTTDSEYLFAALRQIHRADPGAPLSEHVRTLVGHLHEWVGDGQALLNFVACDGRAVIATRHALAGTCPSLYLHDRHPGLGGGRLVASEPLDDDRGWRSVEPHHMVIVEREADAELVRL